VTENGWIKDPPISAPNHPTPEGEIRETLDLKT